MMGGSETYLGILPLPEDGTARVQGTHPYKLGCQRGPWTSPTPVLLCSHLRASWSLSHSRTGSSHCPCRGRSQEQRRLACGLDKRALPWPRLGARLCSLLLRGSCSGGICFLRPAGPGAARQGGHASGAAAGGAEGLCAETEAQPPPHVPQDADEDHGPAKHQC